MTWLSDATVRRLQSVAAWPDLSETRYTVLRELGRGGMGVVYLAIDQELDREVAIKVSSVARMHTEARVLAQLEHPGIVPIHDAGTLPDGRAYYVMKVVRGELLETYLERTPGLTERLRIFERICEPVAFAHARGVVHRDLKPGNVMVGSFGEVLVMDWGVAKVLGASGADGTSPRGAPDGQSATDPGTVMGTRGFMPPEQATGQVENVNQRADVYALGAILFTLLTRANPPTDAGGDVRAILRRGRKIPKRLRAICAKAMAPNRDDRYAGAAELARDVARFRAGDSVEAYPETVLDRAGRIVATYRAPLLLVLAYLVMRILVALWRS